ncbi:Rossmann fold nucleotide-binding protein Smf [Geofilum rubicundum JCM 15548]|uniref:Rossmann fold nucleotide-binding protein Smf n=1 Tax=Geofilum rubicundum JCM 15548 TaxID=1236989 RepID=A0A0E9LSH6_9BACT|nr:Rossmann fold nucleotide-binding protein Smf [Geofilum rubicundum JCM 15548]
MLKHQIALSLINGIGPKLARNLITYLGSVDAVFSPESKFEKIPGIGSVMAHKLKNLDKGSLLARAEQEIDFIQKHHLQTYFFTEDNYPRRLSYCEDAPLLLFAKGKVDFELPKIISIVGTRRPTSDGLILCEKLIADIAQRHPGTLIVSGLAYGIDICAHRAALKNKLPTVAVLAHGLDRIYPGTHSQTAREITQQGALLTEFMTGTNPDRPNFVKRNRIVAGICDTVVVVESAHKEEPSLPPALLPATTATCWPFRDGSTTPPQAVATSSLKPTLRPLLNPLKIWNTPWAGRARPTTNNPPKVLCSKHPTVPKKKPSWIS